MSWRNRFPQRQMSPLFHVLRDTTTTCRDQRFFFSKSQGTHGRLLSTHRQKSTHSPVHPKKQSPSTTKIPEQGLVDLSVVSLLQRQLFRILDEVFEQGNSIQTIGMMMIMVMSWGPSETWIKHSLLPVLFYSLMGTPGVRWDIVLLTSLLSECLFISDITWLWYWICLWWWSVLEWVQGWEEDDDDKRMMMSFWGGVGRNNEYFCLLLLSSPSLPDRKYI
jgi:hypothetical protein